MRELTKVWLNSWYFYNNGYLGFGWMTPQEAREFMKKHDNDIRYEEWFIADVDNYLGIPFNNLEYQNVDVVLDDIEAFETLNDTELSIAIALVEFEGCNAEDAINKLYYYTTFIDKDSYFDCMDELLEIPDNLLPYFDFDKYHDACLQDVFEADNGVIILY